VLKNGTLKAGETWETYCWHDIVSIEQLTDHLCIGRWCYRNW